MYDGVVVEGACSILTTRLGIIHLWTSPRTLLVTQLWCGAERARGIYAERKFSIHALAPRCNGAVVMGQREAIACSPFRMPAW